MKPLLLLSALLLFSSCYRSASEVSGDSDSTASTDTTDTDVASDSGRTGTDFETESSDWIDTATVDDEIVDTQTADPSTDDSATEDTATEDTATADTEIVGPNAFVSRWKTDNPGITEDNQIELPLVENGTYDFTVQWGDGTVSSIAVWDDPNKLHTYPAPGAYTVVIEGTIVGWQFNMTLQQIQEKWPDTYADYFLKDPLTGPDDLYYIFNERKIVEISQWGTLALGDTESQFLGCADMDITASDAPDLSQTTSLAGAFAACHGLTDVPGIAKWDVSAVSDASFLFYHAGSFNGDVSDWDTSGFTTMRAIFSDAESFNRDLSRWDTSNVLDMAYAFNNAGAFNRDIGGWDTSAAADMSDMFSMADSFNQNIGGWDTSRVVDMGRMFLGAEVFNQNLGGWNVGALENASEILSGADSLSTANYDALLVGWASQSVQRDVVFSAGNTRYSPGIAARSRQKLVDEYN